MSEKEPTIEDVRAWKREKENRAAAAARARWDLIRDTKGLAAVQADLDKRIEEVMLRNGFVPHAEQKLAEAKRKLAELTAPDAPRLA